MKDKLLRQSKKEYNPSQRIAMLVFAGVLFLIILPYSLLKVSGWLDRLMRLSGFGFSPGLSLLGVLLILSGCLFALWSIYIQFTIGKGTPVPIMATQKLIIQPPYTYTRNPMALGTIVAYLGVSFLISSISAVLIVFLGAVFLLTYIKVLEEKEMVARFGIEYEQYRKHTPFLIPRVKR